MKLLGEKMVSEKLKELLNKGIAREIQVYVQYMWQHVLATDIKGACIQDHLDTSQIFWKNRKRR